MIDPILLGLPPRLLALTIWAQLIVGLLGLLFVRVRKEGSYADRIDAPPQAEQAQAEGQV